MDYRRTKYCPELVDVQLKKKEVEDLVKKKHPHAEDMHTYISDDSQDFKRKFIEAYNGKCAYCGASNDLVKKREFEIDHFIYKKAPEFKTKKDAGTMKNLVLACHDCNRKKSALYIEKEMIDTLHPDGEIIKNVFTRDELFYIRINNEYAEEKIVSDFYETLCLGSELHRIDFLLMNIIGLQRSCEDNNELYSALGKILDRIRKKRNIM